MYFWYFWDEKINPQEISCYIISQNWVKIHYCIILCYFDGSVFRFSSTPLEKMTSCTS